MSSSTNLEASWYIDPDTYRRERNAIWSRHWIMVAVLADLETPGSYVATRIADRPVLVRRDPSGDLRAFLNVCPHRGGPIAWPGEGASGNLVCRYHGWAFDNEGKLLSARDFGADVEGCALTPLVVDAWGPLVFVNLEPNPSSLHDALGGLVGPVESLGFSRLTHARRLVREIDCNWKTYVDNYLEAYHVPLLHPLLGSSIDVSTYRVEVPEASYCVQSAETRDGAPNSGMWTFRYPNLALNVYPNAMNVERIEPIDHRRTRIVYDYFAADPSEESIADMVHMSNVTLDEDQRIVEVVQQNLESGAYVPGPLSPRHETALVWFQNRIRHELEENP